MNLVDLDILDSLRVEQDNPLVTITANGEESVMIPLEYLYSLSESFNAKFADMKSKITEARDRYISIAAGCSDEDEKTKNIRISGAYEHCLQILKTIEEPEE